MESFDVVIIGAGPAGLKCAETLGNSKFKVLLLEKNSEIGPKVCAGGLTGKEIKYLHLPLNLIDFKFNKIKLHVNNKTLMFRNDSDFIYTVSRKNLGQWQFERLKKYDNIKIRINSRVSKIRKDYLIVNNKKIFYKILVGADGSTSIVKRYLGIKPKRMDFAIQYIIPSKKFKEFEVFFDSKLFSTWYAWIFPHKNYVSVGCGCNPKILPSKRLMSNFKIWLEKNEIDISNSRFESFILDYDYQGYHFENVFLAGDAGGFVSGLTGQGIYPALISGEEIGKIILNPKYKSHKISKLVKLKKKHNRLMNFLIKCREFRTVIFFIGMFFLKVPYFKRKVIDRLE